MRGEVAMTKQDRVFRVLEDRRWWERVGALFTCDLIGFVSRATGTFQLPLGDVDGIVARKLLDLQRENMKLREVLLPLTEKAERLLFGHRSGRRKLPADQWLGLDEAASNARGVLEKLSD